MKQSIIYLTTMLVEGKGNGADGGTVAKRKNI